MQCDDLPPYSRDRSPRLRRLPEPLGRLRPEAGPHQANRAEVPQSGNRTESPDQKESRIDDAAGDPSCCRADQEPEPGDCRVLAGKTQKRQGRGQVPTGNLNARLVFSAGNAHIFRRWERHATQGTESGVFRSRLRHQLVLRWPSASPDLVKDCRFLQMQRPGTKPDSSTFPCVLEDGVLEF